MISRIDTWGRNSQLLAALACATTLFAPAVVDADSISREFTILNEIPSGSLAFTDVVSREFTIFVDDQSTSGVVVVDSVSREFSIFNDFSVPVAPTFADSLSREFTLLNTTATASLTHSDATSREHTIYFVVRCDLNCDTRIDGRDVHIFVGALLTPSQYPIQFPTCLIATADTDNSGVLDAADIPGFVACLLTSGP